MQMQLTKYKCSRIMLALSSRIKSNYRIKSMFMSSFEYFRYFVNEMPAMSNQCVCRKQRLQMSDEQLHLLKYLYSVSRWRHLISPVFNVRLSEFREFRLESASMYHLSCEFLFESIDFDLHLQWEYVHEERYLCFLSIWSNKQLGQDNMHVQLKQLQI
ncbi:Hypothetical_protein [Hexamita inflata]|uniref:Hypothetical_protein n=1 Tax=Hexamita inflata TaxID=28002 RepID=A0AA86VS70_9EUKA|nr:Hypothetical protein HINF_LOCUS63093 [Hexamita inflata]